MSSQNLTGITVMRSFGYKPEVSKLISSSGLINLFFAPFGCFSINLSALTAAICMGPECHPDKDKRYTAAITSGIIYIIIGIFSGVIVSLFAAFPKELIATLAGLALLGTINNCLTIVFEHKDEKEAAMITFLITVSGGSLFGIGAAFWGLVIGVISSFIFKFKRNTL
jgi:benzoate membrane transport protein